MDSFLKKVIEGRSDADSKKYFLRYGKGHYKRRFMISFVRGKRIKIKSSFEFINDFVNFIKEDKDVKFSGKVFSKDKIQGKEGRKKGGSFVYEIKDSGVDEFENVYYYLLNANSDDVVLKVKKSLPKPGKNENKIDNKFCSLDLDLKYWDKLKGVFFWDIPECKRAKIEHEIVINDVEIPENVDNPGEIRELAVRKGKIIRKIDCDGKESEKEYDLSI